jgi:DNA polymerase-1
MIHANLPEAYKLLHEGSMAMVKVMANGICIDTKYTEQQTVTLKRKLEELEWELKSTDLYKEWEAVAKAAGSKLEFTKDEQLRKVLYDRMGLAVGKQTEKGASSVDSETLRNLSKDVPELSLLLTWRKHDTVLNTFLSQILREVKDGVIHPIVNLHLIPTYRSSMEAPSFQNQPKRDEVQAQIVRTAFVPRKGRHLLEIDFSSAEVKGAICYHKDPTMMKYDTDPKSDMHRDMAMQCFKLTRDEIGRKGSKGFGAIRHIAKNGWTFPQFYGDIYMHCAKNMWDMGGAPEAVLADGTGLRNHMKEEGIGSLALFTDHLEHVEEDFWGRRFRVYNQWKDDVWDYYQEHGYVDLLTGFRCSDITDRNKVINRPIQGTAFHWLLWSLTRLQEQIEKRGMKSLIVGQIHDSIILDVPPAEVDDVMEIATFIMTDRIKKHWPWIITPLEIEAEMSPRDGSWYDIKEIVKEDGSWGWKKKAA